ncbi:unnamed protein product [Rotaria sp. Silwood1]|nr:unnamed protein product [Rotaria sp. Silwood1]CAF1112611.1 unnamed protein product [Rotaria sp. Silwood1]CAF3431767.1 unnamed protein product [Rotaria sp. Silwood1]CAF3445203.1 unnamed protein product [Rotaria sp. Silwood1]CAF3445670.1 unnamed protein product [Rotaria sp. Silwood1]
MTKSISSDDNNEISTLIVQKNSLNKIDEYSLINNDPIATLDNNEVYEKIRPLKTVTKTFNEDQAHGDDTHIELSKDQENLLELFSHENQQNVHSSQKQTGILSLKKELNFDDISLQQQRSPIDVCEYEIDLGNGRITKSISSYQSDDKQQQRTTSIISADSIQPTTTSRIPFTNKFYKQHMYPKQETTINHCDESNILFNLHDYVQESETKFSLRTITIFSIGTTIIIILMIVLILFVF